MQLEGQHLDIVSKRCESHHWLLEAIMAYEQDTYMTILIVPENAKDCTGMGGG